MENFDTSNYTEKYTEYFGISPEDFLGEMGILKAKGKNERIPGVASKKLDPQLNPLRGFQESLFDIYSARGVRENFPPIGHSILREIEKKNPVVAAIVNTRCKQIKPFAVPSRDDDTPGFTISLLEFEKKPTKKEQQEIKDIEKWFYRTGKTDFDGWEDREDFLSDYMIKYVREALVIDQVVTELRRNKKGNIIDFWIMDGATFRRVTSGGYKGSKTDFDPRSYVTEDKKFTEAMAEAKLDLVPEMSKIAYVQIMNGKLVAAYTQKDLLFETLQKRTDVRYVGLGFSPLEQAISAITAFLFGLQYNAEAFNTGTLPKIALAFKDGNFSTEQLMSLQDEWIANFRGIQGAWRIPMFNSDVRVIDMLKSPRDMEYIKYLEFVGALICAVMSIDSAELGLRFQQAQSVLSENQGSRMHFSKQRGLNDLLFAISNTMNKILCLSDLGDKYIFKFTGIEPDDKDQISKIRTEAVKRDRTVNEIRAEQDLEPLEYGDVILDPVYLQYLQSKEMAAASEGGELEGIPEGEPEGMGEEIEEIADEAIDEMFKSIDPRKVRTMLKLK